MLREHTVGMLIQALIVVSPVFNTSEKMYAYIYQCYSGISFSLRLYSSMASGSATLRGQVSFYYRPLPVKNVPCHTRTVMSLNIWSLLLLLDALTKNI